ncbi:XK-related protein 9 isoform X2 [Protopterus annectens]|uniref:XK-related protein 9 isoform X2 n=1 Tax=Protopterus annectens TaxID=7888 RepID=UPI001CF9BEE8|nr:XK-related protein 9 isoform X2 [Protopterus annectens]
MFCLRNYALHLLAARYLINGGICKKRAVSVEKAFQYWFAVQYGYQAAIKHCAVVKNSSSDEDDIHKSAVTQATDLCMLRLFETYLESAPQIILQSYILLHSEKRTLIQYAAIVTSFCSISWSTMDYHQSLRKSLPDKKRILWGFPACSYLLYKLFTISSWILSLTLLADVVLWATPILMAILWILGTVWACLQYTTFCTSKLLEYFYRMVVGIILIFTFFNIKGQKTKKHISVYYLFRMLGTTTILCLYWYTKPLCSESAYFPAVSVTVVLTLGLGIICLILYYGFLHPNVTDREQPFDVVDGLLDKKKSRREHFLQY